MREINVRVLIIAVMPALLIALLLGSYFTYSRLAALEQSLKDRGMAIARQLAPAAEFGVFSGNREELDKLVVAVAGESDVVGVQIVNSEGKVLAHNGSIKMMKSHAEIRTVQQSDDLAQQVSITSAPIFQSGVKLESFFDFSDSSDGSVSPPVLGRVYVAMSRSTQIGKRNQALIEIAVITLLILIANMFLAVRMSRNLSRPLTKLTVAVEKIAAGELDTRVEPDSDGAIRDLEEGVNTMALALHRAQFDLQQKITEATMQLEQKKEEAEKANLAKSRFLAAASHDLRQPVHALGLFIVSLQNKPLSSEAKHVVGQIQRSVNALQDLLESLLDISRLDAGTITPNVDNIPVSKILNTMYTNFMPVAKEKELELRMVQSSAVVYSDPILLERILANFLSNAVRYTDHGRILLGCRRLTAGLRIEIWDSGKGIPENQQHEIFAEFYRLPDSRKNSIKGLGLGLAIVERLARLLGYVVTVKSTPGVGSVFSVVVPYGIAQDNGQKEVHRPGQSVAELKNTLVLVVDDDESALAATQSLLQSWDCIVLAASSADEAEALIFESEQTPELLICDYRISEDETGLDVIRRVENALGQRVAAIIISADTSPETTNIVEQQGYILLHKPLRPAKLRALTLHLIGQTRRK